MHLNHLARFVTIAALCLSAAVPVQANLDEASEQLAKGHHTRALQAVEQTLRNQPEDQTARFLQGQIYAAMNDVERAIEVYAALSKDHPELPEPYNNLAVLFAEQNDYDKALNALTRAIQTHPSYATAHANLGDLYTALAAQAYDRALQLEGDEQIRFKLKTISDLHSSSPTKPLAVLVAAPITDSTVAEQAPVAQTASLKPPEQAMLVSSVQQWAQAWSEQDVGGYLQTYHPDFVSSKKQNLAAWSAERRGRITRPKFIKVTVSDFLVEPDNATWDVTFHQHYQADHYQDEVVKTLRFAKDQNTWRIVSEFSKPMTASKINTNKLQRNANSKQPTALALRNRMRIQALLRQAQEDLSDRRIRTPIGNNAWQKYQEVLKIDPQNEDALKALAAPPFSID